MENYNLFKIVKSYYENSKINPPPQILNFKSAFEILRRKSVPLAF